MVRGVTVFCTGASGYLREAADQIRHLPPCPVPPVDLELSPALIRSLSRADQALARLDGAASVIPDVDLFITMYIRDEATRSSQVEGTQATLADVVEAEVSDLDAERRTEATGRFEPPGRLALRGDGPLTATAKDR